MNAIRNLLVEIDQKVEPWELQSAGLEAGQRSRWKDRYEHYRHCRRKAQFVLDGLAVTPSWNPLLLGAAAVCAELLEAYRRLKAEFSAVFAAAERQPAVRRDAVAPRDVRRPRLMVPKTLIPSAALSRAAWAENPLYPAVARLQPAGTSFPDLIVLQDSEADACAPC